jgi:hypothetical protein
MPTKPGGKSIASRFWSAAVETFAGPQEEEHYLIHISKKLILCPISCGPDAASAAQHKKKLQASADYLTRNHGDHFLVWNMTRPDKALFNSRNFDDQVLDVTRFPKYVPTLTFTFEFCNMIRYWLKQDPLNVAVILYEDARTMPHVDPVLMSINTESRIAYLVSAFLAYSKETKITFEALDLVTEIRGSDAEVAVPSQTLYYRYIDDVQSIGFSNTEPILLDCIFVHTIPQLFIDNQVEQCRPILEITCNAEKVRLDERYSNIKHPKHQSFSDKDEIMVFESLGAVLCFTLLYSALLCFTLLYSALLCFTMLYTLGASVWGDVVITCFHYNYKGSSSSKEPHTLIPIFRICFHVGFLQPGGQMQRLKKADLGASISAFCVSFCSFAPVKQVN